MPNKPLSQLDANSEIADTDLFLLSQNMQASQRTSNKVTWGYLKNIIKALINASLPASPDLTSIIRANIKNIIDAIYPIGSIYISLTDNCPILVILPDSTWEQLPPWYYLVTSNEQLNTSSLVLVDESLPNIKGQIVNSSVDTEPITYADQIKTSGALSIGNTKYEHTGNSAGKGGGYDGIYFNANSGCNVYKDGASVRPNSIKVHIFRRTA